VAYLIGLAFFFGMSALVVVGASVFSRNMPVSLSLHGTLVFATNVPRAGAVAPLRRGFLLM
jgi:hypothetical protein